MCNQSTIQSRCDEDAGNEIHREVLGRTAPRTSRLVTALNSAAGDAKSFETFMVLRKLDTRESSIPSPLASYPMRAASHSANLSALFGSRIYISRSVSHLWSANISVSCSRLRQVSPVQRSQRRPRFSNPYRCYCRCCHSADVYSGRTASHLTTAERQVVRQSHQSTSDSPYREVAPA
jgi:hypothetical protein